LGSVFLLHSITLGIFIFQLLLHIIILNIIIFLLNIVVF
jgi:hypothetical protein